MTLPGTTVTSRDSSASRLVPVDVGTWFVTGFSNRGSVDAPVEVRNMQQVADKLGPRDTVSAILYDSLDAFFHEGGGHAVVGRVTGPNPTVATANLSDGADPTLRVDAISPGAWGSNLSIVVAAGGVGGSFTIAVRESGTVVEQSPDLADKAAAIAWAVNSQYVELTDLGTGGDPAVATTALVGGTDDHTNAVDAQWLAALSRFTKDYGPGQVSSPGRTSLTAQTNLLAHARVNDRVALLDGQDTHDVPTLLTQAVAVRALPDARYGGLFAPWAIIPGLAAGTSRTVPWTAVVAGHLARLASLGESPNIAAAGERGIAKYATDLTQVPWTDAERETLNEGGVNVARLHRRALRTYGFRTLVDPNENDTWLQLTNARLYMAIAGDLDAVAEKFAFDQVDGRRFTFSRFNSELTAALFPYYSSGSLFGDSFQEAAGVDTGPQVNTPETIEARQIKALAEVRMSPYGETVEIEVAKVATTEEL